MLYQTVRNTPVKHGIMDKASSFQFPKIALSGTIKIPDHGFTGIEEVARIGIKFDSSAYDGGIIPVESDAEKYTVQACKELAQRIR